MQASNILRFVVRSDPTSKTLIVAVVVFQPDLRSGRTEVDMDGKFIDVGLSGSDSLDTNGICIIDIYDDICIFTFVYNTIYII